MRHHLIAGAGLAAAVGLVATTVAVAAPAQAAPGDLGQTVCPTVADQGSNLASMASDATNATSAITGKSGPPPEMAQLFAQMALSSLCPAAVTSLTNGRLPDVPMVLNDAPGGPLGGSLAAVPGLPFQ